MKYLSASKPTLYFIGVTTRQSSIMRVFPKWAQYLRLGDVEIKGIDFVPHADLDAYREVVRFIKEDPLSKGVLVTTHKLDLFAACRDMFDYVDPHAELMHEVSSISKREGELRCHAKDPISSGLSMDGFLQEAHFEKTGGGVLAMGAGGATIALTWHLLQKSRGQNRPSRIVVTNRSPKRLEHIEAIHKQIGCDLDVEYVLAPTPEENDAVLSKMPRGSLIINATGLGKDAPGSPLSDACEFQKNSVVWELNYRGNLVFLDQAKAQKGAQSLQIEDGWTYFIHGWTQVIAEVFDIEIPTSGPVFDSLSEIAQKARS